MNTETMENKQKPISTNRASLLTLQTLSPVVINSGDKLVSVVDFHIHKGRLYYTPETFWENVLDSGKLLQEFDRSIEAKKYTDAIYDILDRERNSLISIVCSSEIKDTGDISAIARTCGKPYIPASSLKGAMMNALMYSWLKENRAVLENTVSAIERILDSQKGYREKNREIKNIGNNLYNRFSGLEKDVLFNSATLLSLSDSAPVEYPSLGVGVLKSIYRHSGGEKAGIRTYQEYICPNSTLSFTVSISDNALLQKEINRSQRKYVLSPLFEILNSEPNEVLKKIGVLGNDYIAFEAKRISRSRGDVDNKTNIVVLNRAIEQKQTLLCLGAGKSFFSNTVSLLLKTKYEDFFKKLIRFLYKNHKNLNEFPYMHSTIDNRLPGWCALSFEEEEDMGEIENYSGEDLQSGNKIGGIVAEMGKPFVKVRILVDGKEELVQVAGRKNYEKDNPPLREDQKCSIYFQANMYNFNKK